MVLENGFIQIKQPMKANGFKQKNMVKGPKLGLMDIFIKVNSKNSEWSGQGILTFPDGSTYEGEWNKGFMNGEGKFTWSDGKEKIGIWKNGKLQE